jgi:phospholipase/carboxylesterase
MRPGVNRPLRLFALGVVACLGPMCGLAAAQMRVPDEAARQIIELPDNAVASLPVADPHQPAIPALIILLHGAGQTPMQMISQFAGDPDCADAVLLAPKSLGQTWDVILSAELRAMARTSVTDEPFRYVKSIDADRVVSAMANLAQTTKTDPARHVLLGFSDGATFALALGTGRDRPFTAVVALSPGLSAVNARPARGRPVLVMHGKSDRALPFEFTRATIIPTLRGAHLAVRFVPFDGDHAIPAGALGILKQEFPDLNLAVAPPPLFP